MTDTVDITIRVKAPRVPNFLLGEGDASYPVGNVSDEQLRAIGKLWTEALLKRAREQRANKSEGGT
ncbi:MAG: hypothetical protein JKY94_01065 [Rhodobacteraceae bacterium]|nr:hypothetical protein [Paracoccaceae bacterium]